MAYVWFSDPTHPSGGYMADVVDYGSVEAAQAALGAILSEGLTYQTGGQTYNYVPEPGSWEETTVNDIVTKGKNLGLGGSWGVPEELSQSQGGMPKGSSVDGPLGSMPGGGGSFTPSQPLLPAAVGTPVINPFKGINPFDSQPWQPFNNDPFPTLDFASALMPILFILMSGNKDMKQMLPLLILSGVMNLSGSSGQKTQGGLFN